MERKGSSPHSQEPPTCPCHEPDQCSPHPPSHLLKIHFDMTLPSMPRSSTWSLPLRSPTKTPYAPIQSPIPVTCSASPFFIWSHEYPPQHPILEHPHPMFLRPCETPSLTPTQNNKQN